MPYITGGVRPDWTDYLTAFEDAGADLIEVGLPFSDPTVDGPTIQEASDTALARGATPASVLAELAAIRVGIPLIASTYANIALRPGFPGALRAARDHRADRARPAARRTGRAERAGHRGQPAGVARDAG